MLNQAVKPRSDRRSISMIAPWLEPDARRLGRRKRLRWKLGAFSGEVDTGSPPGKCDHEKEQSKFCFYEN
jgi:hypothetical protein